jgi:hypothetical protein
MNVLCRIGLHKKRIAVEIKRTPSADEALVTREGPEDTYKWVWVECVRCDRSFKAYYATYLRDPNGNCTIEHYVGVRYLNISPKTHAESPIK